MIKPQTKRTKPPRRAHVPTSSASLVAGTRRASSASLVAGIRRASSAPLVAQLIQIFALTGLEFIVKTQLASVVQARTLFVTLFNDFCTFAKSQIGCPVASMAMILAACWRDCRGTAVRSLLGTACAKRSPTKRSPREIADWMHCLGTVSCAVDSRPKCRSCIVRALSC